MEKITWRISAVATAVYALVFQDIDIDDNFKILILVALLANLSISLYFLYLRNTSFLNNLPDNIADKNHISNIVLKETFIICIIVAPIALAAVRLPS